MARISMNEIARMAGVSIGTVDRVLHSRGHVAPDKEKRIRQICKEYNYESNIIGKAMYMQKLGIRFAVVLNSPDFNEFNAVVWSGIQKAMEEIAPYNIKMDFFYLQTAKESEILSVLEKISSDHYSGLIIKPIETKAIHHALSHLISSGLPVVTCTSDMDIEGKLGFVGQAHYREGRLMGNMLLYGKVPRFLKIIALTGPLTSVARREKLHGLLDYLTENGYGYEILEHVEVDNDGDKASKSLERLLDCNPDADLLYLHPATANGCYDVLEKTGFARLVLVYGHEGMKKGPVERGLCPFAIYEDPFRQGYESVMMLFRYVFYGMAPADKKLEFIGRLVLKENI